MSELHGSLMTKPRTVSEKQKKVDLQRLNRHLSFELFIELLQGNRLHYRRQDQKADCRKKDKKNQHSPDQSFEPGP